MHLEPIPPRMRGEKMLSQSSLTQAKNNATVLEGYLADAMANGDSAGIAKIIREMTANEKVIDTFTNGEQSIKDKPRDAPLPA